MTNTASQNQALHAAGMVLQHEGGVSVATLSRPERLNALDVQLLQAVRQLCADLSQRPDVRCLVLTGAGKAFAAGADIAAMQGMGVEQARQFAVLGHEVFAAIETLPVPVIAAVNGHALGGGCELALACDLIYAADTASFGLPEVTLGLIPGFGGTQRLPLRVGPGKARELICTGQRLQAVEALRIGLVDAVFPAAQLLGEAKRVAQQIAAAAPGAVRAAKALLHAQQACSVAEARRLETQIFAARFATDEPREGIAAFLQKRPPAFG